jgi:glyoxylase-like metal-dependent hydrolase (beta-lactamase superfamily II)
MQISSQLYLVGSEQFGLSHLLDCNCYLIDYGSGVALIDTGIGLGAEQIVANIEQHGFERRRLSHVLITHTHLGHWGGAPAIRQLTGAQIWAPEQGRYWMEHVDEDRTVKQNLQFGRWPIDLQPEACSPDVCFDDGDELQLGRGSLRMIVVRGHTRDSTCFLWEADGRRALFTGDVVFYAGAIGLINADGSSLEDYRRELPKLAELGVDMLFPGHSVFVLRNGQKHINRALKKLQDFVLPESFFETNEFMWQADYASAMN